MIRRPQSRARLGALAAGLLAIGVAMCATAVQAAASSSPSAGTWGLISISKDRTNAVLVPGSQVTVKSAYDPAAAAAAAGVVRPAGKVSPSCSFICGTGNYYMSASNSAPYSNGNVIARFWTHSWHDCPWGCDDYMDGNSHAIWTGTVPWNADSMQLSERIWEDGWGVSVTCPSGSGYQCGGNTVNWSSGTVYQTWEVDHYWNGVHFWCATCGYIHESVTATAQFGGTFVSTTASSQL